jgi:hypothetical protein
LVLFFFHFFGLAEDFFVHGHPIAFRADIPVGIFFIETLLWGLDTLCAAKVGFFNQPLHFAEIV